MGVVKPGKPGPRWRKIRSESQRESETKQQPPPPTPHPLPSWTDQRRSLQRKRQKGTMGRGGELCFHPNGFSCPCPALPNSLENPFCSFPLCFRASCKQPETQPLGRARPVTGDLLPLLISGFCAFEGITSEVFLGGNWNEPAWLSWALVTSKSCLCVIKNRLQANGLLFLLLVFSPLLSHLWGEGGS